jgi:hypothetical protein
VAHAEGLSVGGFQFHFLTQIIDFFNSSRPTHLPNPIFNKKTAGARFIAYGPNVIFTVKSSALIYL